MVWLVFAPSARAARNNLRCPQTETHVSRNCHRVSRSSRFCRQPSISDRNQSLQRPCSRSMTGFGISRYRRWYSDTVLRCANPSRSAMPCASMTSAVSIRVRIALKPSSVNGMSLASGLARPAVSVRCARLARLPHDRCKMTPVYLTPPLHPHDRRNREGYLDGISCIRLGVRT